jgi:hypothetical protein
MNKIALVIIVIAALAALFHFRSEQREQLRKIRAAEAALAETSARAEYAEQRQASLRNELVKIEAEKLSRAGAPQPSAVKNTPAPEEHPGAKLFRDPEMRAAMKREQVNAMQQNVKRIVDSNLVALLNLTPAQAAALKQLVEKKHGPGVNLLMALMSADASELSAIGHSAQRERDQAEAEIRSFLGEPAYSTYNAYEDSLAERHQLSRLRREFDKTGLTLGTEQESALLQAMVEERRSFPFTHDFHDPMSFDMDRLPEIFGEDSLNQFINEMEQLNNRIIARAQGLLDPQQSGEFAQALRNNFEKSKITVKMTNALFPVGRKKSP